MPRSNQGRVILRTPDGTTFGTTDEPLVVDLLGDETISVNIPLSGLNVGLVTDDGVSHGILINPVFVEEEGDELLGLTQKVVVSTININNATALTPGRYLAHVVSGVCRALGPTTEAVSIGAGLTGALGQKLNLEDRAFFTARGENLYLGLVRDEDETVDAVVDISGTQDATQGDPGAWS